MLECHVQALNTRLIKNNQPKGSRTECEIPQTAPNGCGIRLFLNLSFGMYAVQKAPSGTLFFDGRSFAEKCAEQTEPPSAIIQKQFANPTHIND